jgi:hypothetical protein
MVRGKGETVGAGALRAATGRDLDEWVAVLDAVGARAWSHAEIARHVAEAHGQTGWWAQGVTIQYEQHHGMRVPGQRSDGTFAANASRTVDGALPEVYARAVTLFTEAFGPATGSRATGARPTARWAAAEDGRVVVTAEAAGARIRVSAIHERLSGPDALEPAKAALAAVLANI